MMNITVSYTHLDVYKRQEKYDEEIILKELELETDPLAILFFNLIKFKIAEKKEKYNNSKICLKQLKEQEESFYKIIFNICVYSKLIDILKEIKKIRKTRLIF